MRVKGMTEEQKAWTSRQLTRDGSNIEDGIRRIEFQNKRMNHEMSEETKKWH